MCKVIWFMPSVFLLLSGCVDGLYQTDLPCDPAIELSWDGDGLCRGFVRDCRSGGLPPQAQYPCTCFDVESEAACGEGTGCQWFEPGCAGDDQRLAAAGCFPDTADCTVDSQCPQGLVCRDQAVLPECATGDGPSACAGCGEIRSLCVAPSDEECNVGAVRFDAERGCGYCVCEPADQGSRARWRCDLVGCDGFCETEEDCVQGSICESDELDEGGYCSVSLCREHDHCGEGAFCAYACAGDDDNCEAGRPENFLRGICLPLENLAPCGDRVCVAGDVCVFGTPSRDEATYYRCVDADFDCDATTCECYGSFACGGETPVSCYENGPVPIIECGN